MERGTILKWHKRAKDNVASYELLLDISTKELLKEFNKSSEEEEHVMEIEFLDEMRLLKTLASEGEEIAVGQPIALFCDDDELAGKVAALSTSEIQKSQFRSVMWQGFKKNV